MTIIHHPTSNPEKEIRSIMKFQAIQLISLNIPRPALLLPITVLLIIIPLSLIRNSLLFPSNKTPATSFDREDTKKCDIFSGRWVHYPKRPYYYTNKTCNYIVEQQNCMKFGRPDREFLEWRWKPNECELPRFDAAQFLKLLKGKSIAFVGDSVGRNHIQSLLCLLSAEAHPKDLSPGARLHTDSKWWFYPDYSFTLAVFWSPFFVIANETFPNTHSSDNNPTNLYLDEIDKSWVNQIKKFDYVIIAAGQWFQRPLIFHENGQVVGCHTCYQQNIAELTYFYGYRKAFRTAFETLKNLKGYKGVTIMRTFSPAHYENGEWNKGGSCERKRPYSMEEMRFDAHVMEAYLTQVDEFRAAKEEAKKRGLKFWLLDSTKLMLLRPDGHPNKYGHWGNEDNVKFNDCVHWCLPGPIDTWNEILLYMLRMEGQT